MAASIAQAQAPAEPVAVSGASGRRVVLAIDGSGSMQQTVGGYALSETLGNFVAKLQPDDEMGVVVFDDRASIVRAPARIGADPASAVEQIRQLPFAGQHSDIPAALDVACRMFPEASAAQPVDVLLVTDGIVTVRAPRDAATAVADMETRIVPQCASAGVRVHVIGLGGSKVRHEVLQSIAEATGGRSEFPLGADRLSGFLDAYLAESAPQPKPAPAIAQAQPPAVAPPSEPPTSQGRGWILLGVAAIVAAVLALAIWWWRHRPTDIKVGAHGVITLREMPSGAEHSVRLPATLGRSPSSPIPLQDREASRKHVRLEMLDGKLVVVDLGSANGSFVNGARLEENVPRVLRPGDRLAVPGQEFLVRPDAVDADATYIRQDLDRTFVRPNPSMAPPTGASRTGETLKPGAG